MINMNQWLLSTHSVALFPIGIFIFSWKTIIVTPK